MQGCHIIPVASVPAMGIQPFLLVFLLGSLMSCLWALLVGLLLLGIVLFGVGSDDFVDFLSVLLLDDASIFGLDLGPMVSGDQCWNNVFIPCVLSTVVFASSSS